MGPREKFGATLMKRFFTSGSAVWVWLKTVSSPKRRLTAAEEEAPVTDADACRALAREVRPHVWVNNAGVSVLAPVVETPPDDLRRMLEVNVVGTFHGLAHRLLRFGCLLRRGECRGRLLRDQI